MAKWADKKTDKIPTAADAPLTSSPFNKLGALRASLPEGASPPTPTTPAAVAPMLKGKVVVRMERKGRGGKTVTVVAGDALSPKVVAALAGELKKALGCGAFVEDGRIVLQGDLVERAAAFLEKKGGGKIVRGT